jgi:hypothetical protein
MKTAMASPDEGPDKKKFGIPKKDKKGLAKKTEYKYQSETLANKKKPKPKSKDDGKSTRYDEGKPMKGDPSKFSKHESWMNKPKQTEKNHDQNIGRGKRKDPKNPPKINPDMDPTKAPKSKEENIGKRTKDSQFEKSYKVMPNKVKTKEDLNKKDSPSTKKGKQ